MQKIVTVVGARPQFIKASVVSQAILADGHFSEVLVHTGQHFDSNMSAVFFSELGIPEPAYSLDIHGGQHGAMTGRMLAGIEEVLIRESPAAVLVYGDTNSTLAGALAAAKLHIPVAHVEAGLRSFNMRMPEEINRVLTDRVSRWLFAPTETACGHLAREGFAADSVFLVGDVMYDVALHFAERVSADGGRLGALGLSPRAYVLATVHRAENTDDPARLAVIVDALTKIAASTPVVWPLHPRTRGLLQSMGRLDSLENSIRLIEPLGYLDMVQLEKYAAVIATDSGGVQKEAFFYRVPCVTLRDETEWVELVAAGWNRLAPPVSVAAVCEAIAGAVGARGLAVEPYGDGKSASRIVGELASSLAG